MKSFSILASAFLITTLALVTAIPADAGARRSITTCSDASIFGTGTVLTRDSYLARDMSCAKGFVLSAGATLDLRGHTLTALPDPLSCVGCPDAPVREQPGHAGIVLEDGHLVNGRLVGWESGVRVLANDPASGERRSVSRVTLTGNEVGIHAADNADLVAVNRSVLTGNGTGLSVVNGGAVSVRHSTFRSNTGSGIELINSGNMTVRNSSFSGNGAWGLFTIDATGVGVLTNNRFSANGAGLVIGEGAQSLTLRRNVAVHNETSGIYVSYEESLVHDLGGNQAWGNGEEPQCVGVFCRG